MVRNRRYYSTYWVANGFFPTQTKRKSGILIPTFGESANRGFFLEMVVIISAFLII